MSDVFQAFALRKLMERGNHTTNSPEPASRHSVDDEMREDAPPDRSRVTTGIPGLDSILHGGLPRNHVYLVHGASGAGKTTLGLQFCLAGAQQGERVLYLTACESAAELRDVARSHRWSLDGIVIHHHDVREQLSGYAKQSVFEPAEIELPKTVEQMISMVDQVNPHRLVIDSLSEIRLSADDARWYWRQVLALKEDLEERQCTTLLCSDSRDPDQAVRSIVHGVIELEQLAPDYGPDRRRLRINKMRALSYRTGYHDFKICTGGIHVYPRLVAAEHRLHREPSLASSGIAALDSLAGGGLDRGTTTLLVGPAGTGKSTIAAQFALAAAERGERVVLYCFDERVQTFLQRCHGLGLNLEEHVNHGDIDIRQVDPAELTPGEFSHTIRHAVTEGNVRMVIIDSLSGFVHAMPDERLLMLHLHELLSYLGQQGVTVLLVMAQHGLPGHVRRADVDLSYISDTVLLFHTFEYAGELRKAISLYKRRGGAHEAALRELVLGPQGIHVGRVLSEFRGLLSGNARRVPRDSGPSTATGRV